MGGAAELPITRLGTDWVLSKLRWPLATPGRTRQSLASYLVPHSTCRLTLTAATSNVLQGHLYVERDAMLGGVDVCGGGKRVCCAELGALWRGGGHHEAVAVPLWLLLWRHRGWGRGRGRGGEKGEVDWEGQHSMPRASRRVHRVGGEMIRGQGAGIAAWSGAGVARWHGGRVNINNRRSDLCHSTISVPRCPPLRSSPYAPRSTPSGHSTFSQHISATKPPPTRHSIIPTTASQYTPSLLPSHADRT